MGQAEYMQGQWTGNYQGTNTGQIIINLDARGRFFEGLAHVLDDNKNLPSHVAYLLIADQDGRFQCDAVLKQLDPSTTTPVDWGAISMRFDRTITVPNRAHITGTWDNDQMCVKWNTDIGTEGTAHLSRYRGSPSALMPEAAVNSWNSFKEYVSDLPDLLFRGQGKPHRLRTTFHRAGRANLARFFSEDVAELYRYLSARLGHAFDLGKLEDFGALLCLAQHHGYPTPLLDWSASPYVAAFFAYRNLNTDSTSNTVRIYVFDHTRWHQNHLPMPGWAAGSLHISVAQFSARNNERMLPQQSVSTVTNIDDMETYITAAAGGPYLRALDLPVSERENVMRELGRMGVTASALFPGLDGICETLKERNFPVPLIRKEPRLKPKCSI